MSFTRGLVCRPKSDVEDLRASTNEERRHATGSAADGVKVDGFVHGATGYEDWGLPPEDEAIVAWKVKSLRGAGTHIMIRLTYEAMAAVWPHTDGVYVDVMNDIPKVVFSSTLTSADWAESQIASDDLSEDRLKREPGGPSSPMAVRPFFTR